VSFKNMLKKEIKCHCRGVCLRIKTVLKMQILNLVSEFWSEVCKYFSNGYLFQSSLYDVSFNS
jgi:hypothetical protein